MPSFGIDRSISPAHEPIEDVLSLLQTVSLRLQHRPPLRGVRWLCCGGSDVGVGKACHLKRR